MRGLLNIDANMNAWCVVMATSSHGNIGARFLAKACRPLCLEKAGVELCLVKAGDAQCFVKAGDAQCLAKVCFPLCPYFTHTGGGAGKL